MAKKVHLATDCEIEQYVLMPDGDLSDIDIDIDEDDTDPDYVPPGEGESQQDLFYGSLQVEHHRRGHVPGSSENANTNLGESSNTTATTTNKPAKKGKKDRKMRWKRKDFEPPNTEWQGELPPPPEDCYSPFEYFSMFFDKDMIDIITTQSNLYGVQSNLTNPNFTTQETEQFLSILLQNGIVSMPSLRMYWASETRYPPVADLMSRNRFEQFLSKFHLNDNTKAKAKDTEGYDKLFKLRPMITKLKENMAKITPEECQSVDEQMVPFKGRSSLKQYIKSKPHKWGFKIFMRAGCSGLMHDFEGYIGKGTAPEYGFGISGDIVIHLSQGLTPGCGYKLYFDNWFSSLELVEELKQKSIWCAGTIRSDRTHNCPFKSDASLKAEGRGSYDCVVEETENVALVKWVDNSTVRMISNYAATQPVTFCKRWSQKEKKRVEVERPHVVKEYNEHMGGVDKADMLLELYRTDIRSKKWYMRLFYWILDVSVVNGWLLYKRHCFQKNMRKTKSLLQFRAEIAQTLALKGKSLKRGRPSSSPKVPKKKRKVSCKAPPGDVRYDQVSHWPVHSTKQRCKFCKNGQSRTSCSKCKVALCLTESKNCFLDFHSKE